LNERLIGSLLKKSANSRGGGGQYETRLVFLAFFLSFLAIDTINVESPSINLLTLPRLGPFFCFILSFFLALKQNRCGPQWPRNNRLGVYRYVFGHRIIIFSYISTLFLFLRRKWTKCPRKPLLLIFLRYSFKPIRMLAVKEQMKIKDSGAELLRFASFKASR
jgi:hypothetical protein